jgi:hypothetical protein
MHFFSAANMIKRKEEVIPVFFFQRADQRNQSSNKNKGENKKPFDLSFQDQASV